MGHSIVKQHQAIQQTVYKVALKNEANGQTSIVFKWPAGGSFSGWPKAPSSAISINMFQQRFCSRLCYQVSFSTAWSSFSQFDTVVRHPLASSLKRLPSALHCCHPCTQKRSKVSFILQTITFLNMSNTITIQIIFTNVTMQGEWKCVYCMLMSYLELIVLLHAVYTHVMGHKCNYLSKEDKSGICTATQSLSQIHTFLIPSSFTSGYQLNSWK